MFIVIKTNGQGINLLNFDTWVVEKVKDSNKYAIFAERYTEQLKSENTMKYVFENLGQFDSKAKAERELKAINHSILAGQKGYRIK